MEENSNIHVTVSVGASVVGVWTRFVCFVGNDLGVWIFQCWLRTANNNN